MTFETLKMFFERLGLKVKRGSDSIEEVVVGGFPVAASLRALFEDAGLDIPESAAREASLTPVSLSVSSSEPAPPQSEGEKVEKR